MLTPQPATQTTVDQCESNTQEPLIGIDRYLPYSAQHAILVPVQRLLEEACFRFAQRYLPSALQHTRYDCPAAVELTKWAKILTKHRESLGGTVSPSLRSPAFPGLMAAMQRLRHTAVHRIPVPIAYVLRLVRSAADLAEMLRDDMRAELIRAIHQNIESGYRKSNDVCQALRENTVRELQEIRLAREELDLREKNLVSKVQDEDSRHKRELGRQIERAVNNVIAQWEVKTAADFELWDGSLQPEEPDMKSVITEGREASLGNKLVGNEPVDVGLSWSVL